MTTLTLSTLLNYSQPVLPYCLISEPLAYHSDQLTTNKGIWALKATFCSVLLGWAANLPALFETQIIFNTHEYWKKFENGTSYYVSPITNSWFQIKMIRYTQKVFQDLSGSVPQRTLRSQVKTNWADPLQRSVDSAMEWTPWRNHRRAIGGFIRGDGVHGGIHRRSIGGFIGGFTGDGMGSSMGGSIGVVNLWRKRFKLQN